MTKHRGCQITPFKDGYVWDDPHYGAESDDVFPTLELAKADIDRWFGHGPAPREADGEIYA